MSTDQARQISEAMFNQHAATRQDVDRLREKLEQKIDRQSEKLEQKIDRQREALEQKIDRQREVLEQKIDRQGEALEQRIDLLDQKVGGLERMFTRQLVRLEVLLGLVAAGVAAQLVQQFFR